MTGTQTTSKIQRGLKFTDNDNYPSPKSPKRERPVHKSFTFSKNQ